MVYLLNWKGKSSSCTFWGPKCRAMCMKRLGTFANRYWNEFGVKKKKNGSNQRQQTNGEERSRAIIIFRRFQTLPDNSRSTATDVEPWKLGKYHFYIIFFSLSTASISYISHLDKRWEGLAAVSICIGSTTETHIRNISNDVFAQWFPSWQRDTRQYIVWGKNWFGHEIDGTKENDADDQITDVMFECVWKVNKTMFHRYFIYLVDINCEFYDTHRIFKLFRLAHLQKFSFPKMRTALYLLNCATEWYASTDGNHGIRQPLNTIEFK